MGRAYSMHGEKRIACRVEMGRPVGKSSLGRHNHRWEDIIRMDL
jgi:hypothetical protein